MSQEALISKTLQAGAVVSMYQRLKLDSNQNYVPANAGEDFVAVALDDALSGDDVGGALKTAGRTFKMIADGAISAGATIYNGASGQVSASAVGNSIGVALEAATAAGDIIECIMNNGQGGIIDGNSSALVADGGNGAIPIVFAKQAITDAHTADVTIVASMPYKARIINWWVVARDGTAANIELKNAGTQATGTVAKGTTVDAIVAGSTIIAAQKDLAAGAALTVNASAVAGFDVFVEVIKVS